MKISKAELEGSIKRLNILTGAKPEPYTRTEDGKFQANVGTFYLAGAYGGWKLEKIVSDTGAVSDPLRCGYVSKKELYNLIWAFMNGIDLGEYQANK